MKWLLSLLFFGGLAAGIWWALPPREPTTNAVTVAWELADIRELGELRLLATEIASYQHVTTLDPGRSLTAVVPVRDAAGELRLAGHWVAAPGGGPNAAELRSALCRSLPEYMVPSTLERRDALPLTPNGKVDRIALGQLG